VNRILRQWKQPELQRLGQLYSDADENFLTTLPELEQYPRREAGPLGFYWGPVLPTGSAEPTWPGESVNEDRGWRMEDGAGCGAPPSILDPPSSSSRRRRVFAYVKQFDGLGELVAALESEGAATLLYLDGPGDAAREYESETVAVARERPDVTRVAQECDAAVLHAGQGTTAALLMAGKPVLNIPLVLEQRLTANAVRRTGAGLVASSSCDDVVEKLGTLLDGSTYADAARRLAVKYASFDPAAQVARMVARVEGLIEVGGATATREKLIAG
jgi:hypothetical protein